MPPRANPIRKGTRPGDGTASSAGQPPVFQPAQPAPSPTPPLEHIGVATNMISSLPDIASGADVYARQFYRGSKVPFRRYLPIVRQ